jgi:hypothetical protein
MFVKYREKQQESTCSKLWEELAQTYALRDGRDAHDYTISLHYEIRKPASTELSNPML